MFSWKKDFYLPFYYLNNQWKLVFTSGFLSSTAREKRFSLSVLSYLTVQFFLYQPLILAILKNDSTNVFTTACIELLFTSVTFLLASSSRSASAPLYSVSLSRPWTRHLPLAPSHVIPSDKTYGISCTKKEPYELQLVEILQVSIYN